MKTDKLLRVLTKNAPNRSGRALPLPKYQGPQQSQIGQSLTVAKEVPKELQDKYNSTQARIQALIDNPGQKENPGMAPKDVMEYIKDRSISTLMKENPSLGTTCQGPYCTTAASTAFRLTYPNAAPLPTTGGNTFRDQILQNPAFGVTSNDIYSNLHPGSYLQQQTLEEYYEDEEGNTKQRSKPSYQSTHNMYIYDVENLPSGRKRIHTVQNAGNLHNPESTQFTKAYDVDKEGNIYSQDSDHIVIESARANASDRPLLVYYKGNDVWANPEMNSLLKEREDYKNQILQIDPEYFMPEKPTRYDVDYKPGQFILPENFSSEQGKIVPSKNYKEFIDLRESKVSEIVDQVNNPEYKKMIMRDYNISDAEYNAAVKTMIGQYMMESQGGTDWQSGFRVPEHKGLAKFVTAFGKDLSKKSIGPFQINYDQLSDKTKAVIPKRGVSNKSKQEFVDFMYDPLKSSDIAMRYLAENIRTLRNWANQEGERQNMNSQNYLEFLPYMINQQGWLRRTDEESQSSKGSILGQGTNRYVQGIKEYGDMLLEHLPMSSDTLITNPPTVKPEQQRNGGPTASKAKEILRDGSVHGQPLTDEQKRYFGWIAGGKKQDGGSSTIDTTRPHAYVESPCGPGYVESTDENGNPICINPDTFNQQNSARIDAQRAAQAATMPADNNPSGNPSVSWDVNRDGPYPKNWYNNGPEDDLTSTFMSDCPECEQNSRRLDRRYRRMMRKNNPQPRVSNPIQIPEFTMPRLGIGRFFKNAIKNCRPGERCYTFEDGGPLGQYQGEQSQTGTEALFQKYYGQVDRYDVDPAGFDYYMYRNPEFQTLPPADRLALIKRMKNFLQYESGPRATQAEDVDTNTVFPDTPEQVDRRKRRENTELQTNKDLTPKKPFGHGSYEYEDYKSGGSLPLAQKGLTVLARIDNWIDNAGKDVGKAITNSTDAILDTGIDQIPYVPAAKAFTNIFLEGRPLNAISNILKIPGGVGADFGLNVVQDHLEALENKYLPHTTDKTLDLAHEGLLTKIGLEIAKNKNLPGITEAPKQLGITQKDFNEYLLQNKDRILYKGVSYDTLLKELAKKYKKQKGGRLDTYQGEQSQTGRSAINKDSYWIDLPLGISVANIFDKQFWQDEWERHELGNLFGDSFRSPWESQSTQDRLKELKGKPRNIDTGLQNKLKQLAQQKLGGSTKTLKVRIKKPK